MIAVLTSCFGGYDPIPEPRRQVAEDQIEWLCVTDGEVDVPAPWQTIVEPRPHLRPRMAAKVARCRPDFYTDADVVVWLDAAARLKYEWSVASLVQYLDESPLAQFVHPERSSIREEAEVSAKMGKYNGQPLVEQAAHYVKAGFPDGWGMWATGCIVSRPAELVAVGSDWLAEMLRWSWQDQLSQPYVLWLHGIRPDAIHGNLWGNELVTFDYTRRGAEG